MARAVSDNKLSTCMIEKTLIYGDSFSNYEYINKLHPIDRDDMWYTSMTIGYTVDRTKVGQSPHTMFLQATHDAITEEKPVRIIVALGACNRLTEYTDGWYGEEKLKDVDPKTPLPDPARKTTLSDCEPYFDCVHATKHNMSLFHPTLLWANIYKGIADLDLWCRYKGHELLVLHMHTTPDNTWINKRHPLIAPLCQHTEALSNYLTEWESCCRLCEIAGIQPLDHHKYGWQGHHGVDGQRHFGSHVQARVEALEPWN